jgi:tRNA pseudouridine55 synthase
MGQLAGCGAHLQSLRRAAVGEFQIEDAHTLQELEERAHDLKIRQSKDRTSTQDETKNWNLTEKKESHAILDPESLADLMVHPRKLLPLLPAVTATEDMLARIRHGRPVNLPELSRAREVKVFSGQRDLIAICTRVAGSLFHPKIVLL